MTEIRAATIADTEDLLELARAMHAESPRFQRHEFSEAKAVAMIEHLVEQSTGALFVATVGDHCVGMIAGLMGELFFSRAKYATDLVVFVTSEHRGSSMVVRLVKAFERWAIDAGASEILLGVSTGVATDRTVALYERLGYARTSVATIKRIT